MPGLKHELQDEDVMQITKLTAVTDPVERIANTKVQYQESSVSYQAIHAELHCWQRFIKWFEASFLIVLLPSDAP